MAVNTLGVNVRAYASANVTTSAYSELLAEVPFNCSRIAVQDNSGQLLKIAKGSVGNEVDLFAVPVNGYVVLPYILKKGERLSIRALSATASTGFNTVSFFP